jgi:hypothetical protein
MDFDAIRQRFSLRDQLVAYGAKIGRDGRYSCVIPGHRDKTPSASYTNRQGVEHWRCHACDLGGDVIDLVAEVEGIPNRGEAAKRLTGDAPSRPREARPERSPEPAEIGVVFDLGTVPEDVPPIRTGALSPPILSKHGKVSSVVPSDVYAYHLPTGERVGYVLRKHEPNGDKKILQVRWCRERARWVWAGWSGDDRPPLYNAPALVRRPDAPVLVVEGEKCAKLARELLRDYVVTCWLGGTAGVKRADFSLLAGREVTFWPDNDDGGREAMRTAIAKAFAARSWWVEPSADWVKGYDIYDLIQDETVKGARSFMEGREEVRPKRDAAELPPPGSWQRRSAGGWVPEERFIDLTKEGTLNTRSEINGTTGILFHPAFEPLTFDLIKRDLLFAGKTITGQGYRELQYQLALHTQVRLPIRSVITLIDDVAIERPCNPWAEKLLALQWDGIRRPLASYAGAAETPWHNAALDRWFMGVIARILEPGCKHDIMLVLEGPQGIGKTTFLETLAQGLGFDGYMIMYRMGTDGDHSMMQLDGKIIVELAEMIAYRKSDREAFKALLTGTTDHYRRPYAKTFVDLPRCCVFAGTTNQLDNYLTDPTGNRRIAPVRITHQAQIKELRDDLGQVYAEGVVRYAELKKAGAAVNWFTPDELQMQADATGTREHSPVFAHRLDDYLLTVPDALAVIPPDELYGALGMTEMRDRRPFQDQVEAEMRKRGWSYARGTTRDDRSRRFRRLKAP